jgi:hypothetical protein
MKRIPAAIVVVALCFAAQATGAKSPAPTKEQWHEDLRYFARELPKRHKNVYHATSKEQFDRAVAELDAAIPSLQDHQIIVRMMQIAASVGDGHTGVHLPPSFKRYPLRLEWFGNDLRVTAASTDYEKALGARVVKIGAMTIDDVQARVASCFPSAENENAWYVLATSPAFLASPEVLHTLGVVPELGRAPFTLQGDDGASFVMDVSPVDVPVVDGVPTMRMTPVFKGTPPLMRQRPTETFWFTYLADTQTVYVNFRGYASLGAESKKLFRFIDDNRVTRLVIDMRGNGGGDFFEGRKHLVNPVQARPSINKEGAFFVLIGRRTFSAALANAIDFRKETHATLVGEPIGERPNSYSENDEMTLPNSRLVVSYSTKYYKFLEDDVSAVMPDKRIDPDWAEFRAGRDPAMDWVLSSGSK